MRARGFTLLEMMVGGAMGVFAVTLVLGVFISQNASFQSLDLVRQMNANGRDASLEMENSLKRAGYGIDPNLAFDFTCAGQPAGTKCHDSYNASDDLKFYARNPNYQYTPQGFGTCVTVGGCLGGGTMWAIVGAPTSTLITATLGSLDTIQRGRIVLAMCSDSTHPVYAKVTNVAAGPGNIGIQIAINSSTSTTTLVGDTAFSLCHNTGYLLLIDQYHYFITNITTNSGTEPWLVLDTGIDYNNDGNYPPADTKDLIPVARDVEDLQVAYLIGVPFVSPVPAAPDSNQDWIVANNSAAAAVEEPNPAATAPQNGASNGSMHPGNIRGVRASLVVRSVIADRSLGTLFTGDPAIKFENRSDVSAITPGQFRRMPITLSVATRNMGSANPYLFF